MQYNIINKYILIISDFNIKLSIIDLYYLYYITYITSFYNYLLKGIFISLWNKYTYSK